MSGRDYSKHTSVESVTSAYVAAAVLAGVLVVASYPAQVAVGAVALAAVAVAAKLFRRRGSTTGPDDRCDATRDDDRRLATVPPRVSGVLAATPGDCPGTDAHTTVTGSCGQARAGTRLRDPGPAGTPVP